MVSNFARVLEVLENVKAKSVARTLDDVIPTRKSLLAISKTLPSDVGKVLTSLDTTATNSISNFVESLTTLVNKCADNFVPEGNEFVAAVNVEGRLVKVTDLIEDFKRANLGRFSKTLKSVGGGELSPTVIENLESLITRHYPLGVVLERQKIIEKILEMKGVQPMRELTVPTDIDAFNLLIANNTAHVATLLANVTTHMYEIGQLTRKDARVFKFNGLTGMLVVTLSVGVAAVVTYVGIGGGKKSSGLMKTYSCGSDSKLQTCRIQYGSCEAPTTISDIACKSVPFVYTADLCTNPTWPSPEFDEPVGTPGYTCRRWDTHADQKTLQYLDPSLTSQFFAECDGKIDNTKLAVLSCVPRPSLASYLADVFSYLPQKVFVNLGEAAFDIFFVLKYAAIIVAVVVSIIVGGAIIMFTYRNIRASSPQPIDHHSVYVDSSAPPTPTPPDHQQIHFEEM